MRKLILFAILSRHTLGRMRRTQMEHGPIAAVLMARRSTRVKSSAKVLSTPIVPPVERMAVSVSVAAYAINSGDRFVWNLIRDGKLEVARVGGRTLVLVDSLKKLLAESVNNPPRATPLRCRKPPIEPAA